MDLTAAATPGYFATMEAERRWLRRRAVGRGPTAADYETRDTLTSLTMGTASLLVPLVVPRVLEAVVGPGHRIRRGVLVATAAAAAVTTVADRVCRLDDGLDPTRPVDRDGPVTTGNGSAAAGRGGRDLPGNRSWRRSAARVARRVAAAGGVTTVSLAATSAATWWTWCTNSRRFWARRVLPDLGPGPRSLLAATFAWDFIYYWNHRFMHEVRYLWASHVQHHSSERYNLSTALRQPVTGALEVMAPYGVLSLFGIRPELVARARELNLLYQYWIHTETIDRLGPLEVVLNTPSHHRVHHGSNPEYLDRNYGSILIVWDRLFGTFQPEVARVVYGLTHNINTFNPLRVATHEYRDILRDVAESRSWRDRLSFVLRGPGWAYQRRDELAPESGARSDGLTPAPAA